MRDEKICPTCAGPLVWKGNVLEGSMHCEHCAQVEFIEEPTCGQPCRVDVDLGSVSLQILMDEEDQPTQDQIDANIKAMNRSAGIKPEYAEWDDLCLNDLSERFAKPENFGPWGAPQPARASRKLSVEERNALLDGDCDGIPPWAQTWHRSNRQTGRTHGMVLRALAAAAEGSPVIILAYDPKGVRYIVDMLLKLGVSGHNHYGHFEVQHRVGVGSTRLSVLSVQVSPRGIPRDRRVFADHHVFEHDGGIVFQEALSEWRSLHEIQS